MSESIYYLVGPDAPALAVINECIAERKAVGIAIEAFRVKHGASGAMINGNSGNFVGLRFDGVPLPEGWRVLAGAQSDFFVPNKRTVAGKAIAKEIEALPQAPDSLAFTSRLEQELGQKFVIWRGNTMTWAVYGVYGDKVLLMVPNDCRAELVGCTELKMSEINKIRDEAAAREEAAA